ncbi:hypothetical protein I8751_26865 [Nostocaceae cyanobacterium CENA357]|uniref:Uncharacterized protein n=1 Tax=Atlanticothrix silvestris CENA357 TaxID=1725252 RepID=A0A8J7HIT1_9CYAN|nr:hypothetical protein [Atlanticothrix silvestris]MBH8555899.1 hypothetical protein [Atlanticothrix silvestris CENA357]
MIKEAKAAKLNNVLIFKAIVSNTLLRAIVLLLIALKQAIAPQINYILVKAIAP